MTLLFLDIDGVLNDHTRYPNGYCGIKPECAKVLNWVLRRVPDSKIVVTSAWRYVVHNGHSTVEGLEHLLLTHGIDCKGRVIGVTDEDPERFDPVKHAPPFDPEYWNRRGLEWRPQQITSYVDSHKPDAWIAVDDLPLKIDPGRFCQTDASVGLTDDDADWIIESLTEQLSIAEAKEALVEGR